MNKNLPLLLNSAYYAYNRALPKNNKPGDFQPIFNKDGSLQTTFCNSAMNYICICFGYQNFRGMIANEMFDYMNAPKNGWIPVSDVVAQSHANEGVIVLASMKKESGHGHVCLILPGILENSASFSRSVPKCLNIGKDVFMGKKLSFAFPVDDQPTLFALSAMI